MTNGKGGRNIGQEGAEGAREGGSGQEAGRHEGASGSKVLVKVCHGRLLAQEAGHGAGSDPGVGHLVPLLLGGHGQVEGIVLLALVVLLLVADLTSEAGIEGGHHRGLLGEGQVSGNWGRERRSRLGNGSSHDKVVGVGQRV